MPKQYPEKFKKQVTTICLAGTSLVTVSKKYHIDCFMLSHQNVNRVPYSFLRIANFHHFEIGTELL